MGSGDSKVGKQLEEEFPSTEKYYGLYNVRLSKKKEKPKEKKLFPFFFVPISSFPSFSPIIRLFTNFIIYFFT
jgi:hypothetical protein